DVEQEVARPEPFFEDASVILAGQRRLDKARAVFGGNLLAAQFGGDDRDLVGLEVDMTQQQRQDALADAAEADDDQTAGKNDVFLAKHDRSAIRGTAKRYGRPSAKSRRGRSQASAGLNAPCVIAFFT